MKDPINMEPCRPSGQGVVGSPHQIPERPLGVGGHQDALRLPTLPIAAKRVPAAGKPGIKVLPSRPQQGHCAWGD